MNSVKYEPTGRRLKNSLNKEMENSPKGPNKPNEKKGNYVLHCN